MSKIIQTLSSLKRNPNRCTTHGIWAFVVIAFSAFPAAASADSFEARTYLDIGGSWALAPDDAPQLRLGPFAREESRFREGGLTYVKAFAGARMNFLPWLRAAAYYAHKDFPGSGRQQAHMAVLDLFLNDNAGPLVLSDKNGFEAHVTDNFFRYRNALEIRGENLLGWLSPFARGELRVDSDAARVNMFDIWAGLLLRLPNQKQSRSSLRLLYGYETNRRGQPDWTGVHFLGLDLAVHIKG